MVLRYRTLPTLQNAVFVSKTSFGCVAYRLNLVDSTTVHIFLFSTILILEKFVHLCFVFYLGVQQLAYGIVSSSQS